MASIVLCRAADPSGFGPLRPAKRARFAGDVESPPPSPTRARPPSPAGDLHRPHPLLVKPSGNALLNPTVAGAARCGGLGTLSRLPDELLLSMLSTFPGPTLFRLQALSRFLFAASRHQALWKVLYVSRAGGALSQWDGDWRRTYWAQFLAPPDIVRALRGAEDDEAGERDLVMPADGIKTPSVYSDVLYQPHLCAVPLAHHFAAPGALANLARSPVARLTPAAFAAQYAEPSVPVILTGLIDDWPCLPHAPGAPSRWSLDALVTHFADTPFRAEAVTAPMDVYARYCASAERAEGAVDESPLYLFDSEFVRRTGGEMGAEYSVPAVFGEDLFRVMGNERPDYRWLIVGPSRAGSSWHKDPNSTSAWNAVITGSKGWILFPPDTPPPGVFVSADESEVTAPLSLAEWFSSYYAPALAAYGPRARDPAQRGKMRQGVCRAGEVMYIPAGWWHLVVNLEPSVAVTQNFVSLTELPAVLHFLEHKPDQVSGFKLRAGFAGFADGDDGGEEGECGGALVYARFCAALEGALEEGVLQDAMDKARRLSGMEGRRKERGEGKGKGLWETLKAGEGEVDAGGFGFGFGLSEDGDEELGEVPW